VAAEAAYVVLLDTKVRTSGIRARGSGKKFLVTQSTNDPDPTFLVQYSIHSIVFHLSNMSKVIFGYGNELL
jgi:hypothetical protein